MKVSVIIPAYNCEKYIGQCLDSILASQMDGLEIIAVDDSYGEDENGNTIISAGADETEIERALRQPLEELWYDKQKQKVEVGKDCFSYYKIAEKSIRR